MDHPGNDIILKFSEGDHNVFRYIFNRFYPEIFYFSKKISGCRQEAEDISMCAFQKLFEYRHSFETESQIKAFLYIAARNKCLNYLKYQKVSQKKHSEYARTMAGYTSFHYKYERIDDLANAAIIAIEELPNECRKILKMLYFEELEPNEVAAILQISVRTVYNQKMTAIKTLRRAAASGVFTLNSQN